MKKREFVCNECETGPCYGPHSFEWGFGCGGNDLWREVKEAPVRPSGCIISDMSPREWSEVKWTNTPLDGSTMFVHVECPGCNEKDAEIDRLEFESEDWEKAAGEKDAEIARLGDRNGRLNQELDQVDISALESRDAEIARLKKELKDAGYQETTLHNMVNARGREVKRLLDEIERLKLSHDGLQVILEAFFKIEGSPWCGSYEDFAKWIVDVVVPSKADSSKLDEIRARLDEWDAAPKPKSKKRIKALWMDYDHSRMNLKEFTDAIERL